MGPGHTMGRMRYYCGHFESFYFAYRYGAAPFVGYEANDVGNLSDAVTRLTDFEAKDLIVAGLLTPKPHRPGCLLNEGPQTAKHHILVPDTMSRAANERVVRHRWNGPVPKGAFWRLSDKVYVSTPEFTYLQLAGVLSHVQLALVGCAMVSPYHLDNDIALQRREPMTTIDRLREFLDTCSDAYGAKKARQALAYLNETLTSTLDLHLWARFCFPTCYGGMGLPRAQVNTLVAPYTSKKNVKSNPEPFVANLYWRRQHAAIKVIEELSGPAGINRLLDLRSQGLNIVSISHKYLTGKEEYVDVTPGFFEGFRCLRRRRPKNYAAAHDHLIDTLIGPNRLVL